MISVCVPEMFLSLCAGDLSFQIRALPAFNFSLPSAVFPVGFSPSPFLPRPRRRMDVLQVLVSVLPGSKNGVLLRLSPLLRLPLPGTALRDVGVRDDEECGLTSSSGKGFLKGKPRPLSFCSSSSPPSWFPRTALDPYVPRGAGSELGIGVKWLAPSSGRHGCTRIP